MKAHVLKIRGERTGRRSAADCLLRLESSRLYQARERAARMSEQAGKLAALWYLSSDYRERYGVKGVR